jgi:hypothetical protein
LAYIAAKKRLTSRPELLRRLAVPWRPSRLAARVASLTARAENGRISRVAQGLGHDNSIHVNIDPDRGTAGVRAAAVSRYDRAMRCDGRVQGASIC